MGRSRRLFLALDVPDDVREQLARCSADAELAGARWVSPPELHLTLRFLGGVPEAEVDALRARLAAVKAPAFRVALAGVGVFPGRWSNRNPPRVLWAGVTPAAPVAVLKQAIDDVLGPDAEAAGRSFSPHITLARFKDAPGRGLSPYLERHAALACVPFLVDGFRLYESRTLPDGPRYEALARYSLPVPLPLPLSGSGATRDPH